MPRSTSGATCSACRVHARFDPPGIAFILAGGVRLFFTGGVPPATVYLDIEDLDAFHAAAAAKGVAFTTAPALVHRDMEGQFGPAGESEWMAFLKDPAGNTIGLVERQAGMKRPLRDWPPLSAGPENAKADRFPSPEGWCRIVRQQFRIDYQVCLK